MYTVDSPLLLNMTLIDWLQQTVSSTSVALNWKTWCDNNSHGVFFYNYVTTYVVLRNVIMMIADCNITDSSTAIVFTANCYISSVNSLLCDSTICCIIRINNLTIDDV